MTHRLTIIVHRGIVCRVLCTAADIKVTVIDLDTQDERSEREAIAAAVEASTDFHLHDVTP